VGWAAAQGGIAISHGCASGAVAIAPQLNNALTSDYLRHQAFFQYALWLAYHWWWPTLVFALLPVLWLWRLLRKQRNR
jgi:hypothetical protein